MPKGDSGDGGIGGPGPTGETVKRVVHAGGLAEQRAEDAEESGIEEQTETAEALHKRIGELEGEVAALHAALVEADRSHEMERVLAEADAVDLETVRLLTEMAVAGMEEPDVRLAVEELRRTKPFLFRRRATDGGFSGGAMASTVEALGGGAGLGELADEARVSGDRRALLAYLRERRG